MDPLSREYAQQQDQQDELRHLRDHFIIPSKADLARKTITPGESEKGANEDSTYLCGNSLGLQTKLVRKYHDEYLRTWAQKGVYGHFKTIQDSHLAPWVEGDQELQADMAPLVGASESEVILMQTLTANLHLMMASFYKPTKDRWKIILEGKAFPSDHYAVESQIYHHGFDPVDSMILVEPPSSDSPLLPTEHILSIITTHASETALVLLPGIQYYSGQFLDMPRITAHAQALGITVGWDLAHAVGNVPVSLHDWNVDFAVWCTYKYMNAGPGAMGGCFVHERHGTVSPLSEDAKNNSSDLAPRFAYRPRLTGWWGASKAARFEMNNRFEPIPGAAGYQVSNTSASEIAAVRATLDVFKQTSIQALRAKSLRLTKYLEDHLDALAEQQKMSAGKACFRIITPRDPEQRGVQLSVLLDPGMLDSVMETFEENGVVLDERRPDVIRVAPTPLYNNFVDVFNFIEVFRKACLTAKEQKGANGHT